MVNFENIKNEIMELCKNNCDECNKCNIQNSAQQYFNDKVSQEITRAFIGRVIFSLNLDDDIFSTIIDYVYQNIETIINDEPCVTVAGVELDFDSIIRQSEDLERVERGKINCTNDFDFAQHLGIYDLEDYYIEACSNLCDYYTFDYDYKTDKVNLCD